MSRLEFFPFFSAPAAIGLGPTLRPRQPGDASLLAVFTAQSASVPVRLRRWLNNVVMSGAATWIGLIASVVLWSSSSAAWAVDKHWNFVGQGHWSEANKWSPAGVPGGADNAFIGALPGVEDDTVFMDQDVTVGNLVLTDGMGLQTSIHCCGEDVVGEKLTVLGVTSIGTDARLVVYNSGPGIDFESDTLSIVDNFALIQNAEIQLGTALNTAANGQFRGTGLVQFAGNGTTVVNDGELAHGPGSITYEQMNGGSFNLDGLSGAGLVSVSSAGGTFPDAIVSFTGGGLTDPFSGEIRLGPNSLLDMSVGPWIADANSLFNIFGAFDDNHRLAGDQVTVAGEVDVSGFTNFLIEADAVLAPTVTMNISENGYAGFADISSATVQGGNITLGLDSELEFNGATTLSGGTFNTHSNLGVDGAVRFNGATNWDGDVTINGIAMQWGDAAVSGPTVVTAGVLDMDGGGGTTWDVNNSFVVNVGSVDSSISNTFDGVMHVAGGFAGNGLTVNLNGAFDQWTMAGEMNLVGVGVAAFPINRVGGSPMRVTGNVNVEHRVRVSADVNFENSSVVSFDDAAALLQLTGRTTVGANTTFDGDGVLENGAAGELVVADNASLGGAGLSNRGLLEIGNSAGTVAVDRFENYSSGTWLVEIGGLSPVDFDRLLMGGEATLAGLIEVDLIDAGAGLFLPQIGDQFTILTAIGGVGGQFLNSPVSSAAGMQYHWSVLYHPNDVTLELVDVTPVVPEPQTLLLAVFGIGAGFYRRQRKGGKAMSALQRVCAVRVGRSMGMCAAVVAAGLLIGEKACGFIFISATGDGPADIISQPDNFYSFDGSVITWKMDQAFRDTYNDPVLQDQVRLAFGEWQTASASQERRTISRWGWTRNSGPQSVVDLRSVITHELGHALGLQHPDASYFNMTGPGNTQWFRNFRIDDDGEPFVAAPIGGEVLNEGNSPGFLPNQKPPTGLAGGEYWRTLSRDEVAALDYGYGRSLTFDEVGPNDDAMITVEIFRGSGGNNLGVSGPDSWNNRVPGDRSQGREILTASIGISNNASLPLGVIPRATSWSFTNNTGEALEGINVRADGTSTREPLDVVSTGGHRFQDYDIANTFLLHALENRGHRFSNPLGGSVPASGSVQFGLTLDVWDWVVDQATAITVDGEPIPLSLISLQGWAHGFATDIPGPLPNEGSPDHLQGMSVIGGTFHTTAQGFRVVASDERATLSELAFAPTGDLDLDLADLTPQTLAELETLNKLVRLSFDPVQLEPGEDLVVVMDGEIDDLPSELQASGDFLLLGDQRWAPAMAAGEVLVYAKMQGASGDVGTFSLLNMTPIVGRMIPEPATLALAAFAVLVGLNRRALGRRPLTPL